MAIGPMHRAVQPVEERRVVTVVAVEIDVVIVVEAVVAVQGEAKVRADPRVIDHAKAVWPAECEELGKVGLEGAVKLLEATLQEEKKTDAALTLLAVTVINQEAEAA